MKTKKPRNRFEKKIQRQLRRAKASFQYESDSIPYVLARRYVPDFVVRKEDGILYIECKGYLRPEDKAKLVAVKKGHPGIDLRIVFYAAVRGNIRWAEKHNIPYSIGKVPKEWLHVEQKQEVAVGKDI